VRILFGAYTVGLAATKIKNGLLFSQA
jgi:hypothetical protein